MEIAVYAGINALVIGAAFTLSLRQRWLSSRRRLIVRTCVIWGAAAGVVIAAGHQLLGTVVRWEMVAGLLLVMLLAGITGAAR